MGMTITPIEQDAEVAANIRVSNEIRSWLARRQFTHKQLAPVLGISPGSLSWRMKGKTSWSFTELMKIAAWLDISLSKLLGDELVNEKNPHLVSGEGSERVSGGGSNRGPMD